MWLSLLGSAYALDVAVLAFDGYGAIPYDEVQLGSQGFRDAFLEEGSHFPLSEYDIANRVASGHEQDIAEARRLVAQARTSLDKGQPSSALSALSEALELHEASGSQWARRPEVADIHFFLGQALIKSGRRTEAVASFVEALYLYPAYTEARAPVLNRTTESALIEAAQVLDESPHRQPSMRELEALSDTLRAELLVVGEVDLAGTISATLVRDGRVVGEVRREMMVVPPYPGEPIYVEMVEELLGGTPSVAVVDELPPVVEDVYYDLDEFETDTPRERQPLFGRDDEEAVGTISGASKRAPRGNNKKLTQQWWFWTAAVAVVGGGTGAIVWLNVDGSDGTSTETVEGHQPTYTVTLSTP